MPNENLQCYITTAAVIIIIISISKFDQRTVQATTTEYSFLYRDWTSNSRRPENYAEEKVREKKMKKRKKKYESWIAIIPKCKQWNREANERRIEDDGGMDWLIDRNGNSFSCDEREREREREWLSDGVSGGWSSGWGEPPPCVHRLLLK